MPRPGPLVPQDHLRVYWSPGTKRTDGFQFMRFCQMMANRLLVGCLRYGSGRMRFMTRLEKEVVAYRETGNVEHLVNAANYCYLESQYPENPLHHWDNTVNSVTRGKVK